MDSLVERLRVKAAYYANTEEMGKVLTEAADKIERANIAIAVKPTNQMVLLEGATLRVWQAQTTAGRYGFDLLVYVVACYDIDECQKAVQEVGLQGLASYPYPIGGQQLLK